MVNYVGFVPTDEAMKESWSAPGDPAVLHREFEGWDPRIGNVLKQVDKTFRWALYDREPVPTWTKGRLTLLGDAGGLGQGNRRSRTDGAGDDPRAGKHAGGPASLLLRAAGRRVAAVAPGRMGCVSIPPAPVSVCATRTRRARRIPKAPPLWLRRGAGCPRGGGSPAAIDLFQRLHDRLHFSTPVFLAISLTRLNSSRTSAVVCSGGRSSARCRVAPVLPRWRVPWSLVRSRRRAPSSPPRGSLQARES